MNCWECAALLDPQDNYCRRCGAGQGTHLAWYLKPAWIAILTPGALGPFAIPLIWRTPQLTRRGRIIGTVLVSLFTLWLVVGFIHMVREAMRIYDQQMKGFGL